MRVKVKVKPNSRENSLKQLESNYFEARVSVPPEKGKANRKVAELLSEHFSVPPSKITLLGGVTYKEKLFEIEM